MLQSMRLDALLMSVQVYGSPLCSQGRHLSTVYLVLRCRHAVEAFAVSGAVGHAPIEQRQKQTALCFMSVWTHVRVDRCSHCALVFCRCRSWRQWWRQGMCRVVTSVCLMNRIFGQRTIYVLFRLSNWKCPFHMYFRGICSS